MFSETAAVVERKFSITAWFVKNNSQKLEEDPLRERLMPNPFI
jgi:hypothetical protein